MKKGVIFYLLLFVAVFLVAELLARAYYYRRPAQSRFATYQLLKDVKGSIFPARRKWDAGSQYFFRPDVSKKVSDSIAMETEAANKLVYQPWFAFSPVNSKGRYVSAYDYVRNTNPSASPGMGTDTLEVWFLGGSTMYGLGLTDAETIPAAFVRAWGQKFNRPIKVVNYATPLHYSYQELMLFADNLFRGKVPNMVIMLDGLNDGAEPYGSYLRNPFNTLTLQQLFNPELYHYPKGFRYSEWPDSLRFEKLCEQIYENYLQNIGNVKKLAEAYNIRSYFFWQPIPYYNYRNRQKDPFCAKNEKSQFAFIYPRIKEKANQLDYLYYLADMVNEVPYPFLDSVHYSPRMSEAIARRMLDSVNLK